MVKSTGYAFPKNIKLAKETDMKEKDKSIWDKPNFEIVKVNSEDILTKSGDVELPDDNW